MSETATGASPAYLGIAPRWIDGEECCDHCGDALPQGATTGYSIDVTPEAPGHRRHEIEQWCRDCRDEHLSEQSIQDRRADIPEALQTATLSITCLLQQTQPETCAGWETLQEIDPAEVRIDSEDRIYFPEHVPTECPECQGRHLDYNGVELTFRR